VSSGSATLVSTISERNSYMHTSPQSDDNVSWYRISDIAKYRSDELLLLSNDINSDGNQRISLINTAGNQAFLAADSQIIQTTPLRIASNSQSIVALTQQNGQTNATGYQVSDARLATSACDLRSNCSDVPSAITTVRTLGQLPPTQPNIQLINQADYYTSASQLLLVRAEAPAGINGLSLFANNIQVATFPISGAPQFVENTFELNLPSGTYTITATLTDSNVITTTSAVMNTVVDLTAPQIGILDPVIGVNQLVNELYLIRIMITDDVGLDNLQIINKLTNA
jgi:hypothetical protein